MSFPLSSLSCLAWLAAVSKPFDLYCNFFLSYHFDIHGRHSMWHSVTHPHTRGIQMNICTRNSKKKKILEGR